MAKHSDKQNESNDQKRRENVAAGNKRSLLYVEAVHAVRALAAENGEAPTGARMEALRLADWLCQVLTNTGEPNEPNCRVIEAMTEVMHGENLSDKDRYVIACKHIETAALEYHGATADGHRGYAATVLGVHLYGLDRKFSRYMLPSAPVLNRLIGHEGLCSHLANWVEGSAKGKVGKHCTNKLLAKLLVETGAFDTPQGDVSTPGGKALVEKTCATIDSRLRENKKATR